MVSGDLLNLLETGGAVMYPLLICSVVSIAVVVDRWWVLLRAARASAQLQRVVADSAGRLSLAELLNLTHQHQSPLSNIYRAVLRDGALADDLRARIAQRVHSQSNRELRRFVWILGTIGSLAPFIGLFGTVVGIIRAFENMAATGSGGFAVVAAGISEALVATAGGLLVGVISIFAYNALLVRIANLSAQWRDWTDEFLLQLEQAPAGNEGLRRVVASH